MKEEKDYIRDIAEIRSMMERSSKFLSLAGWAGIMAGIYALTGAWIANKIFDFNPTEILYTTAQKGILSPGLISVIVMAIIILILAIGTAILLSNQKASQRGERLWNPTTRRLVVDMAIPLVVGGILILIFFSKGLIGLVAPISLLFYGLAIYNISKFTYKEVKTLGLIEIGLGLISSYYVEYGLLLWSFGFGVIHIVYGIYLHYKYER